MNRICKRAALCLAVLIAAASLTAASPTEQIIGLAGDMARVYRCNRQAQNTIALTFDDGPHPYLTPLILDILKEYGIRATFFLIGENAEHYPELVNRIRDEGHEIGNHTYSHVQSNKVENDCLEEELLHCESVIGGISDIRPKLFRPPCGSIDEDLGEICDALGYRVILWSIDTRDWCHIPGKQIAETVLKSVKGGDIILMHDYIGYSSPTPDALKQMIPVLIARGYEFAPVSELLDMGDAVGSPQAPK